MDNLAEQLQLIAERNSRVESDKAWETSLTRRLAIAGVTYVVACGVMLWLNAAQWYFAALMPVLGYLLSTLTLPWLKRQWLAAYRK